MEQLPHNEQHNSLRVLSLENR